jgi:hypothetical protein
MIPEWLRWLDNSPEFWGAVGGLAITLLKQLEISRRPKIERPEFGVAERLQYIWNGFLGLLFTHLYEASGSSLTPLTAFITGGGAPIILKQLIAVSVPQHLPGKKEPVDKTLEGRKKN